MLTITTGALELGEASAEGDPKGRVSPAFPISSAAGAADSAVVYFEVAPGEHLPRHTDSAEEILFIVAGTGEAEAGGERGIVKAGDLALIPAMVPHGIANVGEDTLKVVGFFSEADITSTFEPVMQPMDTRVLTIPPVPVAV